MPGPLGQSYNPPSTRIGHHPHDPRCHHLEPESHRYMLVHCFKIASCHCNRMINVSPSRMDRSMVGHDAEIVAMIIDHLSQVGRQLGFSYCTATGQR